MKIINRNNLTQQEMEEMCNNMRLGSELNLFNYFLKSFEINAQKDLERLIDLKFINSSSHLQQGIGKIEYDDNSVNIYEIPLQYPDGRLINAIEEGKEKKSLLGPMTGVFAHVFNNDMYAVHVRGNNISAPGKIQIAAGMGGYKIYPADNALKEVREELNMNTELVLNKNRFLDVTPFMKAGKFPQPLFSYIATGDLNHIKIIIKNNNELEKFVASMPKEKLNEAYPFLVPLKNLRTFLNEVDEKDKFYGPVKRTAYNFLDWYNKEFNKSY